MTSSQTASLAAFARTLAAAEGLEDLSNEAACEIRLLVDCDRCVLAIASTDSGTYRVKLLFDSTGADNALSEEELPLKLGIAGAVISRGESIADIGDIAVLQYPFKQSAPLLPTDPLLCECSLQSHLCLPLFAGGKVLGAIYFGSKRQGGFTAECAAACEIAASLLANTLGRLTVGATDAAARSELREANMFLDSIVENIPDMIFLKEWEELRFVRFNRAGEELLGYPREAMLGKNDYDFFPPEQADFFTAADRSVIKEKDFLNIPEEPIDTRFRGKRYLHTKKILLRDESGKPSYLLGISEDITERKKAFEALRKAHSELEEKVRLRTAELDRSNKQLRKTIAQLQQAEESLRSSLRDKTAMLKEIHHRVKNNLQVISSLLKLQRMHIDIEEAQKYFKLSEERVRSMALVHEHLYRSEELADVDLSCYVRDLVDSLLRAYVVEPGRILVSLDLEPLCLGIEQAVPCGLLLNELITNSLKHAFLPNQRSELRIRLACTDDHVELSVADNGRGFPDNFGLDEPASFGSELIGTLCDQLEASIQLRNRPGAEALVRFEREDGVSGKGTHGEDCRQSVG